MAFNAAVKQRLSEAIKKLRNDRSQRVFAEILGVGHSAVQQWELCKGGDPSFDSLEKIANLRGEHLDEFVAYLLGRDKQKTIGQLLDRPASNAVAYDSADYVKIPIVANAGAGGGANPHLEATEQYINFPAQLIRKYANPAYVDALQVLGDSMSPTLNCGDLVLIDTQSLEVSSGIYVFVYEGDIFVKRLARFGKKISITSDNPVYLPQELGSVDVEFKLFGKVFYVCQKV